MGKFDQYINKIIYNLESLLKLESNCKCVRIMSNCSLHSRGTIFFSLLMSPHPILSLALSLHAFPFLYIVFLSPGAFPLALGAVGYLRLLLCLCVNQWWPLHQSVRCPVHSRPATVHSSCSGPDIALPLRHWDINLIRVDPQSVILGNRDHDQISTHPYPAGLASALFWNCRKAMNNSKRQAFMTDWLTAECGVFLNNKYCYYKQ